jgi:hypothetical protein
LKKKVYIRDEIPVMDLVGFLDRIVDGLLSKGWQQLSNLSSSLKRGP